MGNDRVSFGKYELISRLAAGGMAEIFLARATSIEGFEKYLVIKRILKQRTGDLEFVRMFLDEARLAATLDHPNIVHIYDVGHVDNEYFIAMEYLRGRNLIEIVRAGAKLGYPKPPLEYVLSIITSVCAGLNYAHEKRDFQGRPLEIVHRDITPQNIVVRFDGGVKIVDFGIAKVANREVETRVGTLKGKIGYMSPEQCLGRPVDRRSDLFALGIILYELTTGRRLYHGRSDFETLKKIIEGEVSAPRELIPSYPPDLDAIVMRCLQREPAARYQTALELHADIDAFIRNHRLVTGTVPLGQYMERLFAADLNSSPAEATEQVYGQSSTGSMPSYLGEASRSSLHETPLVVVRREHVRTRLLQAMGAALVVGAATGVALWKTRPIAPPVTVLHPAAVAAPSSSMAKLPPATNEPPRSGPSSTNGGHEPERRPSRLGQAHVTVATTPRCELLVDGVSYGKTPVIDVAIAAGRHTVTLLNPEEKIVETQRVTLRSGQLWTRSFRWSEGRLIAKTGFNSSRNDNLLPVDEPPAIVTAPPPIPKAAEEVSERAPPVVAAPKKQPKTDAPPPPTPVVLRNVASFVLDAQRLSGSTPHLSSYFINTNRGRHLSGTYKICVNPAGHVYEVRSLVPLVGADDAVAEALRGWTYKPQSSNVCSTKIINLQIPSS